jgi:hypothetical protein
MSVIVRVGRERAFFSPDFDLECFPFAPDGPTPWTSTRARVAGRAVPRAVASDCAARTGGHVLERDGRTANEHSHTLPAYAADALGARITFVQGPRPLAARAVYLNFLVSE